MGFLDGLFGNNGSNFQAQQANLLNPATVGQANQTFDQSQAALAQQNQFLQALQGQNGIGNQQNVFNQYAQLAAGQGPNPALAQLQNTTGQNINQQAALMASQRGTSANPGLMARQAAMQGGALQQSAAGQAAAMQAQQQLAAMQQMQQMAQQQVAQQQQATGASNQFAQGLYGQVTGNINAQNNAAVANASQANQANAQIAAANQRSQSNMLGNLASGAMSMFMPGGLAAGAMSGIGSLFGGGGGKAIMDSAADSGIIQGLGGGTQAPASNYAQGPVMASQGGMIQGYKDGGYVEGGPRSRTGRYFQQFKDGGYVAGKAEVPGDHPENDKVQALLSPDEIVIPRSIVLSKNAPEKAAMFVEACLAKKGMR